MADKAQTYPKKQTGVTLKWVGPHTSSDHNLTETVLESIFPEGAAEAQRVECKIETVAWRKRHISASVEVAASAERVWRVLTDYERLAEFIPNLAKSERIPCPTRGRIWLLQLGVQSSMYWQIEARVVLDLEEKFAAPGGPELHFSMVEGDFKLFAGKWALRESNRHGHVTLHYEVDVLPRAILPTAFVERIIQADLPRNLRAIANRAQALMTSSTAPSLTSAEGAAPILDLEIENGNGSSTALPPSVVTVATGAGAGLDLEVSWWSGPGQPPNPGLIGPACESATKTESEEDEDRRGNDLTTGVEGGGSALEISNGSNGKNGLNGESGSNGQPTSSGVTAVTSPPKNGAGNGTPRKRVNGLQEKEVHPEAKGPTNEFSAQESRRSPDAHSESELRSAVENITKEPVPKPGYTATKTVRWEEERERGRKTERPDTVRDPVTESNFQLVDAPYFPAECTVIPPEDRDIRAGFKQRVDEVHLRRLDDLLERGGVHRRVVAAITIAATVEAVWDVLTDYERLKDFIPNLARSDVRSRHPDERRVRLHQVGVKCLCYMVLHAQATMDIVERPYKEIHFKQIDGDFDTFEGRWLLEPLGPGHTMLKYVVETRVRKNSLLPEALVEEVIYEDLPANLCAIRKRVESLKSIYSDPSFRSSNDDTPGASAPPRGGRSWGSRTPTLATDVAQVSESSPRKKTLRHLPVAPPGTLFDTKVKRAPQAKQLRRVRANPVQKASAGFPLRRARPKASILPDTESRNMRPLSRPDFADFGALTAALEEFILRHGVMGVMPTRSQLRGSKRADLEKGMRLHGGPAIVAARLGLEIQHQQKPAGYWCDLANIEREIKALQPVIGVDRGVMPSRRMLERAGRFDIARALEKWGGAKGLAAKLGLKVVNRNKVRDPERTC
ncbi:hypothetical protein KFL_001820130 [Klebsormidium nitens]|uniref:Coenzyme Q-binding protein COQ10 START domain-containing protein n=1 Tax=Klebsormidium nitens TaxID=105231 RepID=A0A1Y1HZZ8_KLENI|nr:hypothetical protein KFL_001820130 [Klebsormidium nitens]|eukprot:GAQ84260.1 hypothetical protein KFL_001820130 [Klebsormidium nitens]